MHIDAGTTAPPTNRAGRRDPARSSVAADAGLPRRYRRLPVLEPAPPRVGDRESSLSIAAVRGRSGSGISLIPDLDAGEANDSGLVFRPSDDQWVYNLGSRHLQTGSYVVTIRLPDGTDHQAGFVLK